MIVGLAAFFVAENTLKSPEAVFLCKTFGVESEEHEHLQGLLLVSMQISKKSILVLRPLAQGREDEENNHLRASCNMPGGIYFKA